MCSLGKKFQASNGGRLEPASARIPQGPTELGHSIRLSGMSWSIFYRSFGRMCCGVAVELE